MRITIELLTDCVDDLEALGAMIDRLRMKNMDKSSGPVEGVDPAKVTIWTSAGKQALARQTVNLIEDVEVEFAEPAEVEKPKPVKPKRGKPKADAKAIVEAVVNVKTEMVETDGDIDAALKVLDPPKPEAVKTDAGIADVRKALVKVVMELGPTGAAKAGEVVKEISGVKDVTKIPLDKFGEVLAALESLIDGEKGEEVDENDNPVGIFCETPADNSIYEVDC